MGLFVGEAVDGLVVGEAVDGLVVGGVVIGLRSEKLIDSNTLL